VFDNYIKVRAASEQLKREAFLMATSQSMAPTDALPLASEIVSGIDAKVKSALVYEEEAKRIGSCPTSSLTLAQYQETRAKFQINYYKLAARNLVTKRDSLKFFEFIFMVLAALISLVSSILGKGLFDFAPLAATATTVAGAIFAHVEASRYDQRIIEYRSTASRLETTNLQAGAFKNVEEFAKKIEDTIESETKTWVGLFADETKTGTP
jgi:ATP-dependent Lon protease